MYKVVHLGFSVKDFDIKSLAEMFILLQEDRNEYSIIKIA